jgi:prepilin-type N-terminal cleavage/methylation domain-containing protein
MPVMESIRARYWARRDGARGFTLTELAIVVAVIALLLGGLTLTLSTQTELRRITDTQRTLDLAKDALMGFAMTHGRFPCPAVPTIATGAANAGLERSDPAWVAPPPTSDCWTVAANQWGVLPWATLGVPETDAWGRRFSYRVFSHFADPNNATVGPVSATPPDCPATPPVDATKPSFMLCSQGNVTVQTRNPADRSLRTLAATLPVVIVSHGANGFGAYQPDGTQLPAPPGADEAANANSASVNFRIRETIRGALGCDDATPGTPLCEFDDLVSWVPLPVLMNRMVASGKLPY